MKRFLSFILPVVLLLAACSKEKSLEIPGTGPINPGGGGGTGGGGTATYFLTCKIDGVAKTFNVELEAFKQDTLGNTIYTISGYATTDPADPELFAVTVGKAGGVTPGTYSISNITGGIVAGIWATNDPTKAYLSQTGDTSTDPFTVTITSVTATEIAGTFKGKLFDAATGPTGSSVTVTEGSFKAQIL